MKQLTPERKQDVRKNLTLAGCFTVLYSLVYLICGAVLKMDTPAGTPMTFFAFFETLGTLLLVTVFLHRFQPMYFYGIVLFACFAQFGGAMLNFYDFIPIYDLLLHGASGILLVLMGHYLLSLLLRKQPKLKLPGSVTLWFSWLFATASAGVWEIFEFTMDQLFGLDCQLNSLPDTMTDIIAGTVGAIAGAAILWAILRKKETKSD